MKRLHPRAAWMLFLRSAGDWIFIFAIVVFSVFFYLGLLRLMFAQAWEELVSSSFFSYVSRYALMLFPLLFLFLLFFLVWEYLYCRYYRYDLTEEGFWEEAGVIRRDSVLIPYKRIQDVSIVRGFWERVFGLSIVRIQTAGDVFEFAEGGVPGILKEEAELLRDELISRSRRAKA